MTAFSRRLHSSRACAMSSNGSPAAGRQSVRPVLPLFATSPSGARMAAMGYKRVIDGRNVKIRSLSNEETLGQSETSLSCRYLMELSDSSKRWVRLPTHSMPPVRLQSTMTKRRQAQHGSA